MGTESLAVATEDAQVRLGLGGGRITVGRAPDNDLVVLAADVSRHHLCFELAGTTWLVRDLGSRHGTRLNGVSLAAPVPIAAGDRIDASTCELRVLTAARSFHLPRRLLARVKAGVLGAAVLLVGGVALAVACGLDSGPNPRPHTTTRVDAPSESPLDSRTRRSPALNQQIDQVRHAARVAAEANDPILARAHYRKLLELVGEPDSEHAAIVRAMSTLARAMPRVPTGGNPR